MAKMTKALYAEKLTEALEDLDTGSWVVANELAEHTLCDWFPMVETKDDIIIFVRSLKLPTEDGARLYGILMHSLEKLQKADSMWR